MIKYLMTLILLAITPLNFAAAIDTCDAPSEWSNVQSQVFDYFKTYHPVYMSIAFIKQELNLPFDTCPINAKVELIEQLCGIAGCQQKYLTLISYGEDDAPARIRTVMGFISLNPGIEVEKVELISN